MSFSFNVVPFFNLALNNLTNSKSSLLDFFPARLINLKLNRKINIFQRI